MTDRGGHGCQRNIAGDGSLVLKLYYTRDSYKVTYQYTGKVPTGASELPAETTGEIRRCCYSGSGRHGPGLTFSGWSREEPASRCRPKT